MENLTIKLLDESGKLLEHKILFTFECEELGKNYVAYEDNEKQEICVASYDPELDLNKLEPVTDPEELIMAQEIIDQLMED